VRIRSLDSIRGLAALWVVFAHTLGTYLSVTGLPLDPLFQAHGLSLLHKALWTVVYIFNDPIGAGTASVMIFFVLSGFVLALPFISDQPPPRYMDFAVRRFCRIYIPFAFSVVGAMALYSFVIGSGLSTHPHTSVDVFQRLHERAVDDFGPGADYSSFVLIREIALVGARQLTMSGIGDNGFLNHPTWSLIIEMRISLILPLLCMIFLRFGAVASLAGSALIFATAALAGHFVWPDGAPIGTAIATVRYILFFMTGIWLASLYLHKKIDFSRVTPAIHALLWGVAIVGLLPSWVRLGSSPAQFIYLAPAALLIALCVYSGRAHTILALPPIVWLGRVSYSLYLIHVPILYFCFNLLYGRIPLAAVFAVFAVLLPLASEAAYRWIEVPSIRLGRVLSGKRHLYS
jgi:peptidoglycan/LPS O-acetylase OafA/YrhL